MASAMVHGMDTGRSMGHAQRCLHLPSPCMLSSAGECNHNATASSCWQRHGYQHATGHNSSWKLNGHGTQGVTCIWQHSPLSNQLIKCLTSTHNADRLDATVLQGKRPHSINQLSDHKYTIVRSQQISCRAGWGCMPPGVGLWRIRLARCREDNERRANDIGLKSCCGCVHHSDS